MLRGSLMKGAATVSSATASTNRLEQLSGRLDCPFCFIPLVRIKTKQLESNDQYFTKCPYNVKGDPTTCGFIRSEDQYEAWAAKRHWLMQAGNVDPTAVMQSGEGLADLRHEVNQLKQIVVSVATEVWNLKMQQGSSLSKQEAGNTIEVGIRKQGTRSGRL